MSDWNRGRINFGTESDFESESGLSGATRHWVLIIRRRPESSTAAVRALPNLSSLLRNRCIYHSGAIFTFFQRRRLFRSLARRRLAAARLRNACGARRRQARLYHRRLPLSYPVRRREHRA